MKKLLLSCAFLLVTFFMYASEFVHPLDYKGTDAEKEKLHSYIEENIKDELKQIGLNDSDTLNMEKKEEIRSFNKLRNINDRGLLDKLIKQYSKVDMCDYSALLSMYNAQKEVNESKQEKR
jgi:hypothetical protein